MALVDGSEVGVGLRGRPGGIFGLRADMQDDLLIGNVFGGFKMEIRVHDSSSTAANIVLRISNADRKLGDSKMWCRLRSGSVLEHAGGMSVRVLAEGLTGVGAVDPGIDVEGVIVSSVLLDFHFISVEIGLFGITHVELKVLISHNPVIVLSGKVLTSLVL